MHTPGAQLERSMHPAIFSYANSYIKVLMKKHAHPGCTGAKICAPGSQNVHAGCTLNFEDCPIMGNFMLLKLGESSRGHELRIDYCD